MKITKKTSAVELAVYEYIAFQNPIVTIEDKIFVNWYFANAYNPRGFKVFENAKRRCSSILSILYKRGFLDRIKVKNMHCWRYAYFIKAS